MRTRCASVCLPRRAYIDWANGVRISRDRVRRLASDPVAVRMSRTSSWRPSVPAAIPLCSPASKAHMVGDGVLRDATCLAYCRLCLQFSTCLLCRLRTVYLSKLLLAFQCSQSTAQGPPFACQHLRGTCNAIAPNCAAAWRLLPTPERRSINICFAIRAKAVPSAGWCCTAVVTQQGTR